MHKLLLAIAPLILAAGIASAWADDSGHIGINSLNAELPRSDDPLAPVSDGMFAPNQTDCSYARGGTRFGCTWTPYPRSPR